MAQVQEQFEHRCICPGCRAMVDTVPAEGVPDQQLRACVKCEEVFWLDEAQES